MPAKNSVKMYVEDGYYHIYNRGVEKRQIFLDHQDYIFFLGILKKYLSPPSMLPYARDKQRTLFGSIELLSYCLMPNHFHLLIHQNQPNAITKLLRGMSTAYVVCFNERHQRVGTLFQGIYKAVLVQNDEQLLYLTAYIHRNPLKIQSPGAKLCQYPYSSYPNYLGQRQSTWLHPETIQQYFSQTNPILSYRAFVEDELQIVGCLEHLCIDDAF